MSRIDYAIENHRKMWNWIADAYESGRVSPVRELKHEYLNMTGNKNILGDCFLCDYAGYSSVDCNYLYDCSKCLLDWGIPSNSSVTEGFCTDRLYYKDDDGLYGQLIGLYGQLIGLIYSKEEGFCEEASHIARKIANLPIRSDIKTIYDESEEISNE